MSIVFDEIPTQWYKPGTYLETKANYRNAGVLPYPARALVIGQTLAAGTIAAGQIVEVTRPGQAENLFGLGSIGAEQVEAFRLANRTTPLFVMGLPDAEDAVKATGTFTFTGTIGQPTVLRFRIDGKQVRMTAAAGDTVAQLATKLAAAITADTSLTVTAAAVAGVVTCTARNAGEVGNEIDLRVDTKAQALPTTLGVAVAAMSGGTGNPDIEDAFDVIGDAWYTHVQHPWNDATNLSATATWATQRYTAMAKRDVHVFVGKAGTYGELTTFGGVTNCRHLTLSGLKGSPTSPWVLSAALMGLAVFHLVNDPARQLRSLVLPGVVAPDDADQFTDEEMNLLLQAGISTFESLPDGAVTIDRVITTYKVSALNVRDDAWLDIMVPATLSRIRYDWNAYVSLLYPRSKLVSDENDAAFAGSDDTADPGNAVVTPRRLLASWAARCRLYGRQVWLQDVERTVGESLFELDESNDNRVNARQQIKIAGNLMVLAGSLEFQV